jgi:hypothetical protein
MNGQKRWRMFLRLWDTIYAGDFEETGDLIEYLSREIDKIKKVKEA